MNNATYSLLDPKLFEEPKVTLERQSEAEKNNGTYFPIFIQLLDGVVSGWVVHVSSLKIENGMTPEDDMKLGVEYEVIYSPTEINPEIIETNRPVVQEIVSKAVLDILEQTVDNLTAAKQQ